MSEIQKVYTLSIVGGKDAVNEVELLNTAFDKLRKVKQDLNEELGKALLNKDSVEQIDLLRKKLADVEKEMADVSKQQQKNTLDEQRAAKAKELLAKAELANVKAARERTRSLIEQEKELDRLIAKEEKAKRAVDAQAGSYDALKKELRELYRLVNAAPKGSAVVFQGNTLGYDQAIQKLKELSAAEQDYRRQFAKDQLLVGEYTTGIIQAFKQLGADDLIGGQIQKANDRLKQLDQTFQGLKADYDAIKNTGVGAFDAIEKEMLQNRKEAEAIKNELTGINQRLQSVDQVGTSVTTALRDGFRGAVRELTTYALGFASLQALLSAGQRTLDNTIALDSLDASLRVVSKSTAELAKNQAFLLEITNRLGVEYVATSQAFKNFFASYTEAGGSTDEARQIFENAVTAAASLKLSQDDLNGALVAFGQIASKGKVQAEELRGQIGERLPGAFAIAARAIGVSQAELNKMLENGQVLSTEFLPKFAAELRKTFGGSGEQVEGLQARINRLKNEFSALIRDNQKGLTTFFNLLFGVGSVLLTLIGYFPQLLTLLALYGVGWAVLNKELVISQARLLLVNAQLVASRIALGAVNIALALSAVAQRAYTAALLLFTGAQRAATAASVLFGNALRLLPLGIILTLLGVVAAAFRAFGGAVSGTTDQLKRQAIQQEVNLAISEKANQAIAAEISQIQTLTKVAQARNISDQTRLKALRDLVALAPEYLQGLTLENIRTSEGIALINQYVAALREKASLEAAQSVRRDFLEKDLKLELLQVKLEQRIATGEGVELEDLTPEEQEFVSESRKQFAFTASVADLFRSSSAANDALKGIRDARAKLTQELEVTDEIITKKLQSSFSKVANAAGTSGTQVGTTVDGLQKQIEQLNKQIDGAVIGSKELAALLKQRDALQKTLDTALNKGGRSSGSASRLTGGQRDQFKDIEAEAAAAINAEKLRVAEIRKVRELSAEEEINSLEALAAIEQRALDQKLAKLKGANAEERRLIQEFNLEKTEKETELQEAIQEVRNRAFATANADIKARFEQQRAALETQLNLVLDNPLSTEQQKAAARAKYFEELLRLQEGFNLIQKALEVQNKQTSIEGETERAEAIRKIRRDLVQANAALDAAAIEDLKRATDLLVAELEAKYAERARQIRTDTGLSGRERSRSLRANDLGRDAEVGKAQLDGLRRVMEKEKELFEQGKTNGEAYFKAKRDYYAKLDEIDQQGISRQLNSFQRGIDGFKNALGVLVGIDVNKQIGKTGITIGQLISESYNIAAQAMNSFFDAQRNRIEEERSLKLSQADAEKQRLLDAASSAEERELIEKKFQQRKAQIDREAGEKLKRQKRAELAISLASELASIAAQAAANPANAVTFGAAGATQFAILAGLAIARSAFQLANINKQQFAEGGQVQPADPGNGRITIGPNIPMQPNGDNVLATVRTGEVILNERQQRALGGSATFARIGVPGFAGGGLIGESMNRVMFEGAQAPVVGVDGQGNLRFGATDTALDSLLQSIHSQGAQIAALNERTDRIVSAVLSTDRKAIVATEVEAKNRARKAASDYPAF